MKIKNENGFTLIEMMVVLAIAIVVSGLGIAAYFANLPHLRLISATRGFKGDLSLAQQLASRENRTVRVTLRSSTTYEIVRIEGDQDPFGALVDDVSIKTVNFSTEYEGAVSFSGAINNNSLYFVKLSAVDSSASTFITSPYDSDCGNEFRVVISRTDGNTETKKVCINSGGRIRIP